MVRKFLVESVRITPSVLLAMIFGWGTPYCGETTGSKHWRDKPTLRIPIIEVIFKLIDVFNVDLDSDINYAISKNSENKIVL